MIRDEYTDFRDLIS